METIAIAKRNGKLYEIHFQNRQIVVTGDTEHDAWNAALHEYGSLCRSGNVDPRQPGAIGVGRIAHVLSLAGDALNFWLQQSSSAEENMRNQAGIKISALGTAIAALARVGLD